MPLTRKFIRALPVALVALLPACGGGGTLSEISGDNACDGGVCFEGDAGAGFDGDGWEVVKVDCCAIETDTQDALCLDLYTGDVPTGIEIIDTCEDGAIGAGSGDGQSPEAGSPDCSGMEGFEAVLCEFGSGAGAGGAGGLEDLLGGGSGGSGGGAGGLEDLLGGGGGSDPTGDLLGLLLGGGDTGGFGDLLGGGGDTGGFGDLFGGGTGGGTEGDAGGFDWGSLFGGEGGTGGDTGGEAGGFDWGSLFGGEGGTGGDAGGFDWGSLFGGGSEGDGNTD